MVRGKPWSHRCSRGSVSLSSLEARGKIKRVRSTGQNRDFLLKRSRRSREPCLRTTVLQRMIVTRPSTGKTTKMVPMSQRAYNKKTTPLPRFLVPSSMMLNTGLISRATGLTSTCLPLTLSIRLGFSLTSITTPSVLLLIHRTRPTTSQTRRHSSRITQLRTFMSLSTTSTCSNITHHRLRLNQHQSRLQSKKNQLLPRLRRWSPPQRPKILRSRRHQRPRNLRTRQTDSILMRWSELSQTKN